MQINALQNTLFRLRNLFLLCCRKKVPDRVYLSSFLRIDTDEVMDGDTCENQTCDRRNIRRACGRLLLFAYVRGCFSFWRDNCFSNILSRESWPFCRADGFDSLCNAKL